MPQIVGKVGVGEANEDVCGRFARPPERGAPTTLAAALDSSLLSEEARCGAMPRPPERVFIGEPDECAQPHEAQEIKVEQMHECLGKGQHVSLRHS